MGERERIREKEKHALQVTRKLLQMTRKLLQVTRKLLQAALLHTI